MQNPDEPPILTPEEWERYAEHPDAGPWCDLFAELAGDYATLYWAYANLCRSLHALCDTSMSDIDVSVFLTRRALASTPVRCTCQLPGSGGSWCTGHCFHRREPPHA